MTKKKKISDDELKLLMLDYPIPEELLYNKKKVPAPTKSKLTKPPQLDLHFKTVKEALTITENFLHEHLQKMTSEVLIITGKGFHSKDYQAKLKPAISDALSNRFKAMIVEFSAAPIKWGGTGVFLVRLR